MFYTVNSSETGALLSSKKLAFPSVCDLYIVGCTIESSCIFEGGTSWAYCRSLDKLKDCRRELRMRDALGSAYDLLFTSHVRVRFIDIVVALHFV
jgi:hypothetical protein